MVKHPIWLPLSYDIYNKSVGKTLLCRLRSYENSKVNIRYKHASALPTYDDHFFLRPSAAVSIKATIENSKHIPRGMLEFWLYPESVYFKNQKLDIDKEMILFCAGGLRSALAAKSLKEMGYEKVSHIEGGFSSMKNKGFKVV